MSSRDRDTWDRDREVGKRKKKYYHGDQYERDRMRAKEDESAKTSWSSTGYPATSETIGGDIDRGSVRRGKTGATTDIPSTSRSGYGPRTRAAPIPPPPPPVVGAGPPVSDSFMEEKREGKVIKLKDEPRNKLYIRVPEGSPLSDIIKSFKTGTLPPNTTFTEALDMLQNALTEFQKSNRFTSGSKEKLLVDDVKLILSDFERLLLEKNKNETLQRFFMEAKEAAKETAAIASGTAAGTAVAAKGKIKSRAQPLASEFKDIVQALQRSIRDIATSGELRSFLVEIIDIFSSVFGRTAQTVKDNVQNVQPTQPPATTSTSAAFVQVPIQSAPTGMGEPTLGSQQTFGGGTLGASSIRTYTTPTQPVTVSIPSGTPGEYIHVVVTPEKTTVPQMGTSTGNLHYSQPTQTMGQSSSMTQTQSPTTLGLKDTLKQDIMAGSGFTDTMETAKSMAKNVATSLKEGVYMEEEEKRRLIERVRNILIRAAEHKEFRKAFRNLLRLWDDVVQLLVELKKDTKKGLLTPHQKNVIKEGKKLIEAITGRPVDPVLDAMYELWNQLRYDAEASKIFSDFRAWIEESLKHPELLRDDVHFKQLENFVQRFRNLASVDKYTQLIRNISNELLAHLKNLRADDTLSNLYSDFKTMFTHLVCDSDGNFSTSSIMESLTTARSVFFPILLNNLQCLPLPKIEGATDKFSYAIDHLVINLKDIVPERIHFRVDTDTDLIVKEFTRDMFRVRVACYLDDIHQHLRDVWFYMKKFSGFKWEDYGVVNIDLAGLNIFFDYIMRTQRDGRWLFGLRDVTCQIDYLNVEFVEAKHKMLDTIGATLLKGRIKKSIQKAIENQIRDKAMLVSSQLTTWQDTIRRKQFEARERKLRAATMPVERPMTPVEKTRIKMDKKAARKARRKKSRENIEKYKPTAVTRPIDPLERKLYDPSLEKSALKKDRKERDIQQLEKELDKEKAATSTTAREEKRRIKAEKRASRKDSEVPLDRNPPRVVETAD